MLLAMMVPCVCVTVTFGMTDELAAAACERLLPLYMITLTLALPAGLFYFLQERVKNLGLYLLCTVPAGILFLAALAKMQFALDLSVGGEQVPQALILLLFLLDAIRMRTNDNSRRKAKAQEDHSWRGDLYLLPLPSPLLLIPFAVIYVSALFLHSGEVAQIALTGSILYFFLVLPYHVLVGKEAYLESRHHISRIPKKRIARLQGAALARVLVPSALLAASALMTSGQRRFLNLPDFPLDLFPEPERIVRYRENGLMRLLIALGLLRAGSRPPQWLVALINFTENALTVFLTALIAYFFWLCARSLYLRFRLRPDSDVKNPFSPDTRDEHVSLKKPRRTAGAGRKGGGIRRRYRRTILRFRGAPPEIYETPSMMEDRAGIPDTEEMRSLHDEYLHARYDR